MGPKPRTPAERSQQEAIARAAIEDGSTWPEAAEAIEEMGLPPVSQRTLRLWAQENGWYHLKKSNISASTLQALRDSRTPGTAAYNSRIEALNGWTPEQRQEAAKEVGEAGLELIRQAVILANRVGEVSVQESFDGKLAQIVVVRGADVEAVTKSAALAFEKADRLGGIPADVSMQLAGMAGQLGQAVGFTALDRIFAASKNMLGLYDGALPATAIEAMRPEVEPELVTVSAAGDRPAPPPPPAPPPLPTPPPPPPPVDPPSFEDQVNDIIKNRNL